MKNLCTYAFLPPMPCFLEWIFNQVQRDISINFDVLAMQIAESFRRWSVCVCVGEGRMCGCGWWAGKHQSGPAVFQECFFHRDICAILKERKTGFSKTSEERKVKRHSMRCQWPKSRMWQLAVKQNPINLKEIKNINILGRFYWLVRGLDREVDVYEF